MYTYNRPFSPININLQQADTSNMKFTLAFPIFVSSVAAFTPQPLKISTTSLGAYPTVNWWTVDPSKFCAGLPGALAPVGEFDPLNFLEDLPIQEIKRYREAEVTLD